MFGELKRVKEHRVPEVWRRQHQMQIGILDGIHKHIVSREMPFGSLFYRKIIFLRERRKDSTPRNRWDSDKQMAFFTTAVTGLKTVVTAIGAGVGVWGVINLLEGYGNDNPGAKSQGIKQLMSGGGIIIVAQTVIPQLSTLFS
jgi:hypothetical protein